MLARNLWKCIKISCFLVQDVQLNASKTLENQHSCPRTNSHKPITYETKLQENKDNFPSKNVLDTYQSGYKVSKLPNHLKITTLHLSTGHYWHALHHQNGKCSHQLFSSSSQDRHCMLGDLFLLIWNKLFSYFVSTQVTEHFYLFSTPLQTFLYCDVNINIGIYPVSTIFNGRNVNINNGKKPLASSSSGIVTSPASRGGKVCHQNDKLILLLCCMYCYFVVCIVTLLYILLLCCMYCYFVVCIVTLLYVLLLCCM